MKKTLFTIILIVYSIMSYSQVGINTSDPKAILDVMGKAADTNFTDGIIAPRLTGNQLKAKDALYGIDQTGAIVYVTSPTNPTSTKTQNINALGYYYFDGSVWVSLKGTSGQQVNDAKRFLGGTVYVKFMQQSGGNLNATKEIGGADNASYYVGTLNQFSKKGGIDSVVGNGYTISNPTNGVFDIKFDVPLTQIYGISVNILDSYGYNNGAQNSTSTPIGTGSITTEPGTRLLTNDNSQVSFISNSVIRIKTGNSNGTISNRSFTFLVVGN